jgi:hypothetical protein
MKVVEPARILAGSWCALVPVDPGAGRVRV